MKRRNQESWTVVVAEKPAVARAYAEVLGAARFVQGFWEGNGYRVTCAIGHLVQLADPGTMNPDWKAWSLEQLPLIPNGWVYAAREEAKEQLEVVTRLLRDPSTAAVICGTDAGREGEHIFRLLYEFAGCAKPVTRVWLSAMTPDAIRQAFERPRPWAEFDGLAEAADARDKADWIVGMSLSRLYALTDPERQAARATRSRLPSRVKAKKRRRRAGSVKQGPVTSTGRVQTPVLGIVVARDAQRAKFVRTPYRTVQAEFGGTTATVKGVFYREVQDDETAALVLSSELPAKTDDTSLAPHEDAEAIVQRVSDAGRGTIVDVVQKTERKPAPQLFDLSALQQECNRRFGFSAAGTLELVQGLYDSKLLSYPRTDCRYLDEATAQTLPEVFAKVGGALRELLPPGAGSAVSSKRYVDGAKVGDHYALIPTGGDASGLEGDPALVYELVRRRFCQMWADSWVTESTTVHVAVRTGHLEDLFLVRGRVTTQAGWKALELSGGQPASDADGAELRLAEPLTKGTPLKVASVVALDRTKKPKAPYTEGTLLRALETAGREVEDPEAAEAMRECGLGTPATRHAIIETLIGRGYLERKGKSVCATPRGDALIARVCPELRDPRLTGQWERRLRRIERGEDSAAAFLNDIAQLTTEIVSEERARLSASSAKAGA